MFGEKRTRLYIEDEIKHNNNELMSNARFIIMLMIMVLVFTQVVPNYVFSRLIVDGGSMCATLNPTYMDYGYRDPMPNDDRSIVGVLHFGSITYGDIVVAHARSLGKDVIKRVIAFEGDTVRVIHGGNNDYAIEVKRKSDGRTFLLENEPYALRTGSKWEYSAEFNSPYTVPEGYVFIVGDNRVGHESHDCFDRLKIKRDDVFGRVIFVTDVNGFHFGADYDENFLHLDYFRKLGLR